MASVKKKSQRKLLVRTCLVIVLFFTAAAGFIYWAANATDSDLARSIRQAFNIREPLIEPMPAPVPLPVVEAPPAPEPPQAPAPPPLPEITYAEIARRSELWPEALQLELSKRVYIRYNGNVYGHMQFTRGMHFQVDGLGKRGEAFGWIDGMYLSLSIDKTNFEEWFHLNYGDRYRLHPIEGQTASGESVVRHKVGTPQGDAEFWAEMRLWCDRNYDSISLEIQKDTLVFRWHPKEGGPIDYKMEAREIARNFLLKRTARGSNENYAACEIRHPVTDELLGTSSIFIPQL